MQVDLLYSYAGLRQGRVQMYMHQSRCSKRGPTVLGWQAGQVGHESLTVPLCVCLTSHHNIRAEGAALCRFELSLRNIDSHPFLEQLT